MATSSNQHFSRIYRYFWWAALVLAPRVTANQFSNGDTCIESSQCASGCCAPAFLGWGQKSCQATSFFNFLFCQNSYEFKTPFFANTEPCGTAVSSSADLTFMSYNIYLILIASDLPTMGSRVREIGQYFINDPLVETLDVVLFNELWMFQHHIQHDMQRAGFCHWVYDERWQFSSGLGVFSRWPIAEHDFRPFEEACNGLDCVFKKGVIYTKIMKEGTPIHLFGTHTISDAEGPKHETRCLQYAIMRDFIDKKNIPGNEVILLAGDMNEDLLSTPGLYSVMLQDLDAGEFSMAGDTNKTWHSNFFREFEGITDNNYILDYVLYDKNGELVYADAPRPTDEKLKTLIHKYLQ